MALYADSLGNLKYSQGMVSFRLFCADHPEDGGVVFIPFSDMKEIVDVLLSELTKIRPFHLQWLDHEAQSLEAISLPPDLEINNEPAGEKIGQVR